MESFFTASNQPALTMNFWIRKSHRKETGETPINIRLIYLGKRRDLYTGLFINPIHWRQDLRCVDQAAPQSQAMNKELVKIQTKVEEIFETLKRDVPDFTIEDIIIRIKVSPNKHLTIVEYIDEFIEKTEKKVGISLTTTTLYKFKRTARYFKEFLLRDKKQSNLSVSRIDKELLEDFFHFLRREKKNSHNSSSALMGCLRTILDEPVKRGIIRYNPFNDLKLTREPVTRQYLVMEEIEKLQKLEGLSPRLELCRDLFLFCCFTGMAYSDLRLFNKQHIITEPDGSKHIEIYRKKSKVLSYIPLMQVAESILQKYSLTNDYRDFRWVVPWNSKLNEALKSIAYFAGIEKPLFTHLGRHTFATTVTLSQRVSIESVSKMLGHTTLKHTQLYAKIVNNRVKEDMAQIKDTFKL